MRSIGAHAGREVRAVLTDMGEPLGRAVGNALEVREAIACLQGGGPADLREIVLVLGEEMLAAAGLGGGRTALEAALDDGAAFERWQAWVRAQGGRATEADELELAPGRETLPAPRDGTVGRLDALPIGEAVKVLGGGRETKRAEIDLGVGIELHAKVGDTVEEGEPLVTIYHRDGRGVPAARAKVEGAIEVVHDATARPLVLGRLT